MDYAQKKTNKKLITACIITGGLISAGLFVPYLNVVALLAAAYFVFSMQLENITCFMIFIVSFFPIFKISLGGFGLYNILLFVAILKLVFMSGGRISGVFIPSFLVTAAYILVSGFLNDIAGCITCICYLLLAGLICSQSEMQLNLKRVTVSSIWGVISTSVLALLSDYIPRLSTIISQARIKLGQGNYYYRFSGIEANPNYYTMIISVCIGALVVLMLQKKAKLLDYIYLAILCVFGFMSVSNSFLVSLIAILIMFAFSKKEDGGSNLGTVVIVGLALLVAVFILNEDTVTTLLFRMDKIATADTLDDSTTGRTDLWLYYIKYLLNNPIRFLFGRGVGASNLSVGASHNFYIDIIYYMGLIGGTIYVVCLNRILNPQYLLVRKPRSYQYIPLCAFLIRAFARNLFMSEQLVFMLLICFLAIYSDNVTPKESENHPYIGG